jgi:hypothetical protein
MSIPAGMRHSTDLSKSTGQLHFAGAVGRVVGKDDRGLILSYTARPGLRDHIPS